jgi:magnesium-protoporphyrin O-methyltransferase
MSYDRTLATVEAYFDKTATRNWERLTSDAPVSRIRETVRRGREDMRTQILTRLPSDLHGARILDAGCGAGQMTAELAARGATVVAADISPSLIDIARQRLPIDLAGRVHFHTGDMLDDTLGDFDHVVAMDSLIYYAQDDLATALARLGRRSSGGIVFTVAPRTPLLMAMWRIGQLFPRSDRSPTMVPHTHADLSRALAFTGIDATLLPLDRISSGFYISQALELKK